MVPSKHHAAHAKLAVFRSASTATPLLIALLTSPALLFAQPHDQQPATVTDNQQNSSIGLNERKLEPPATTNKENVATRLVARPVARSWKELLLGTDTLKKLRVRQSGSCHPHIGAASDDGNQIAWIGIQSSRQYTKYKLYVYDVTNATNRQLTEWSQPSPVGASMSRSIGWSPDGKRLAIGGITTMLAIVDVTTGEVEETGVSGSWAIWSPDGQSIMMATPTMQFGKVQFRFISGEGKSYFADKKPKARRHTVPQDGRIAVWLVSRA